MPGFDTSFHGIGNRCVISGRSLVDTGERRAPCPADIECAAVVRPTTVALAESTGSRSAVLVRSRNVRPRSLAARADRDGEGVARSQRHTLITA